MSAADRWRVALAAWAIPEHILAAAPESPYGCPVSLFARAADAAAGASLSAHRAAELLPPGGSVLDVGCGAGAASLPLVPPAARLTGVDESRGMLDAFAERAALSDAAHEEIEGRWPDVAASVASADVVVCHHVLYNVPELEPFLRTLGAHAGWRVVIEITERHPWTWTAPLWRELWGLDRPDEPSAAGAAEVLREMGIDANLERWSAPPRSAALPLDERVPLVRRMLCLPAERDGELRETLDRHPLPAVREVATIFWNP